jgi:hypothetical protein
LKAGPNFRAVTAITVGLSATRQVRPQLWSGLMGKVVHQALQDARQRLKLMAMNQCFNIGPGAAPTSQVSRGQVRPSRRPRLPRLRKHQLGDFHQLFESRQDQGHIDAYRLGDVIVLHCGWRAQGLEPGSMVTVKGVLTSGVEVYFDCRQEGARNAVLGPADLSTWDLSVHRQPVLVHPTRAPSSVASAWAAPRYHAASALTRIDLVEDW